MNYSMDKVFINLMCGTKTKGPKGSYGGHYAWGEKEMNGKKFYFIGGYGENERYPTIKHMEKKLYDKMRKDYELKDEDEVRSELKCVWDIFPHLTDHLRLMYGDFLEPYPGGKWGDTPPLEITKKISKEEI